MEPFTIPLRPILIFAVVLARISGLVVFAPFWSNRAVTPRVRATLALAVALVVTPVLEPQLATPPVHLIGLAVVMAGEVLIGLALGFVGRMMFTALELAAQILSFQMGFLLASTIDPATRVQTPFFGVIAQMFGLMVLLGVDGHHWLLDATARSFRYVQPGTFAASPQLADLFLRMSGDALAIGIGLATPAIVLLLAVELALAIAGRAAPQLQVMVVGFPVKIVVGLWLVGAALYFIPAAVRSIFSLMREWLSRVILAM